MSTRGNPGRGEARSRTQRNGLSGGTSSGGAEAALRTIAEQRAALGAFAGDVARPATIDAALARELAVATRGRLGGLGGASGAQTREDLARSLVALAHARDARLEVAQHYLRARATRASGLQSPRGLAERAARLKAREREAARLVANAGRPGAVYDRNYRIARPSLYPLTVLRDVSRTVLGRLLLRGSTGHAFARALSSRANLEDVQGGLRDRDMRDRAALLHEIARNLARSPR